MPPNATSWLAGGVSSEEGRAACVRVTGSRASLFGTIQGTTEKMAIDVPLHMENAKDTLTVHLEDREPTFLEVQVRGQPRAGVTFILKGRDTGVSFLEVISGDDGQTRPTDLLRQSRASAILTGDRYWMPAPSIEVQPGRNLVEVLELGTIKIQDIKQLQRMTHKTLGTSPATWLHEGSLTQGGQEAGTLTVPAGRYLIDRGQGNEGEILVGPERTVDSGF